VAILLIHLIFGSSGTSSLSSTFCNKRDQIIGFPIDFSIGPLTNIHERRGINYFNWLESSFQTIREEFKEDQRVFSQSIHKLLEIKNGEKVTIWTCENASEQIGLRICCYLLENKQVELIIINTFYAMHQFMRHDNVRVDIRHTGECNDESLAYFYKYSKYPISVKERSQYEQDGQRLLRSKSMVRSWKQGRVMDESETRDDKFILNCVKRLQSNQPIAEFLPAVRVVGEVIGLSEQTLSDSWIEYRIRSLISANQLAYKGNLKSMRLYKIKVVS